jgi:aerobic-type carbon monoxide dehydrogenase small subunit (CoxS/CutS family)
MAKKVSLVINGMKKQVDSTPDMVLIDLLRDVMHLTGTK